MKKMLILLILSTVLSCTSKSIVDCTEYKGPNECIKFYDGREAIWEWLEMKRISMLIVLSVLLYSCKVQDPSKCTDYTGPKECIKFSSGKEIYWGD